MAFREHGANAWYDDAFPPSTFLGKSSSSSFSSSTASCPSCGGTNFEKLRDILDVWFDSGVSHAAVLRSGDYGLADPYTAEPPVPVMYLEGHDQHRGWFQSSLLTSVALTGRAPFDTVLTHGFVVAGDGRKMSKSLGNTIEPQDLLKTDGADVIRLWVASLDYTNDDPLSKEILQRTSEAYRKIRNTAQFLLGNLFDFDPGKDAVPTQLLEPLERYVLDQAARVAATCREAFGSYAFHSAVRALLEFVTSDLSAFWCDVRKDAFYILAADDAVRRSAQTAAWKLVEMIAIALSPICPFTAEEIFESLPGNAKDPSALFLKSWSDLELSEISSSEREAWGTLLALRARFLAQLEPLRREGRVGNAAQAVAVVGRGEDVDRAMALLHLSEENLLAERLRAGLRPSCATPAPRAFSPAPPTARSARAAGRCARTWSPARTGSARAADRSSAVRIPW